MMKKVLILTGLLIVSLTSFGQYIGTGTSSNCVGGFNVYYFSGGSVNSWTISGASYTNLVYGSGNSSISFNWTGASTNTKITANYSGGYYSTATFVVSAVVTPSVSISPATVSTTFGTSVTLTAIPSNGGTTPTYYWYLNGILQPGNTNNYTSTTLQNADQVYVRLQSSATCVTASSVNSANTVIPTITYSLTPPVVSPVTIEYNTSAVLTATGAGANEVYRWYTLKSGGSYLSPQGLSISTPELLDNTTYYVSKYNTSTLKESARVSQLITLIVPPPTPPVVSTNTCGGKTLTTSGTPPASITWNWQGTNPAGTSTNSNTSYSITEATSQTYYIRAKANTANIWSTAVGVEITTDPVDIVVTSYQPQNTTIQATHSITFKPGVTITTGNQLTARIAITWECNDIYNWSEQIVYDQNELPLSRSRTYSTALGQELQSQAIDMASGKIWVTQPIYDKNNNASASTLPAPISEGDFIFKKKFVTNVAGQPYSDTDFNLSITGGNALGEIKNPKPVDNTKPNTLGWYYSTNNTLEPNTPTTSIPYARSYTPEGPDPIISTATGPGDQYKMGSNHEVVSERQKFIKSELLHYFALRPFFVTSPLPVSSNGTNLLSNPDATSLTGFTATANVILSLATISTETYIKAVNNQMTTSQGIFPIGGTISVTAGSTYTFKVKGYRSSVTPVAIVVQNATTSTLIPVLSAILPASAGNEDFVETTFIVPTGCTSIKLGVQWTTAPAFIGDSFFINSISLTQLTNPETMTYGYRSVSTDPDGKKSVSFSDADGHTLATAIITSTNNTTNPPTYTYDYWSYNYYNDMGQAVATVAPNGVIIGNNNLPQFVTTFKYDHLGRLIETTSLDEGTSRFVYSLDGKIRFSENSEQRGASPKRFSYTNYDSYGRLIESGEYISNGTNPFVFDLTTSSGAYSVLQDNTLEATGYTGVSRKLDAVRCTDYTFIEYNAQALDLLTNAPNTAPYNVQINIFGHVTKTENANSKTWYSYDEFGQLTWSKTKLTDSGFDATIIGYTYDYFGNVTQVAYQKNGADKFYHHYVYDVDQRLTEAHTSLDGNSKTLRAKYMYYLHGPLKRVELMNGSIPIQGIDYVYRIDGSLKTINNAEIARDPGGDGVNNGFPQDIFGMTLHYHDNDYTATYNAGPETIGGYTNQYGGLIKAQSWHNATDNNQGAHTYAYAYDNVNQLSDAKYGNVVTGSPSTFLPLGEVFRESVTSYDKNGNIKALIRKGKTANVMGDYAYSYESNSNRLDKVNQQTTAGALVTDFSYNTIGQMTTQVEGDGSRTMKPFYNAYGLVKEVKDVNNALTASYVYDDQGNRVQQLSYNAGSLVKTTYYVHDASDNVLATYEKPYGGTLKLIEVPVYGAGRIGMYKPALTTPATFYELTDHLGNVRAVIGSPESLIFTATVEDNGNADINNPRVQEMALFKNLSTTAVQDNNMNHTAPSTAMPLPKYSSYLKWISGMTGQEAKDKSIGPAIGLKVQPGDKLDIETWAKFRKKTSYSRSGITNAISSILGASYVGTAPGLETVVKATAAFQSGMTPVTSPTPSGNGNDLNTVPFAYVYYLLYDRNSVFITAGWARVPTSAGFDPGYEALSLHQKVSIPQITINESGYIYIFASNESENTDVWFDDLKITHQRSNIVAGADYYPFGLAMDGREITREDYRYGYQGQYSEKDKTTGWNEFELRMYDSRFGRWISPDPYGQFASPYVGMGNTPNGRVDTDGGWSWITAGAGFVVGAAVGYFASDGDLGWTIVGGIAGGAIGGASFSTNTSIVSAGSQTNALMLQKSLGLSSFGKSIGNTFSSAGSFFGKNSGALTNIGQSILSIDQNRVMAGGACCPGPCCPVSPIATTTVLPGLPTAMVPVVSRALPLGAAFAIGWEIGKTNWFINNIFDPTIEWVDAATTKAHHNLEAKKRSNEPIGGRNYSSRKKDAYEKAKRAGDGGEPELDPDDGHGGPHYHPTRGGKRFNHDHYYFPKNQF